MISRGQDFYHGNGTRNLLIFWYRVNHILIYNIVNAQKVNTIDF